MENWKTKNLLFKEWLRKQNKEAIQRLRIAKQQRAKEKRIDDAKEKRNQQSSI
jgi:hypothetical protein